jgi:hypothetical protein
MEEAYRDEAAWNSAVRETRKRDPVSCGDLLRYGAVVKTWSKDPERDLREAIRIFDKESVPVEAAWCRLDLASHLRKNSSGRERLLDEAYRAFEKAKDRDGMSSVLEARGSKEELPAESDPTNGPALAMGAGAIIGMVSFIGLMSWEGGILNTISIVSITGCLTGLGILVAGIYLMWKVPLKNN